MQMSATTEGSDSLKDDDLITTLSYSPIHIEDRLDLLSKTIQTTRRETPENNTRLLTKLERWLQEIKSMQEGLKRIREDLVPYLEGVLGITFEKKELFQVAMFQPSTKNIFMELETQYRRSKEDPLGSDGFAEMINLGEMAKVLALVGDAVISSAVLQHLWEPHLGDAGKITQRRSEIVSNEHMAKLCDAWGLYGFRIHFDPDTPSKSEMNHDKGTLLEAIYGIIYLEKEYKMVLKKVTHLINTR
ncbi:MAG: ribonuclease III domain-containing protein [Candidatus Thorarchaeota archaeon]